MKNMENELRKFKLGAPWEHNLEINELGNNLLKAKVGLAGVLWVLVSSIVLFLISISLLGLVWITFPEKIVAAIVAGGFSIILLSLAIFFMGCYSYLAELEIDESNIKFSRCFFWSWKRSEKERNGKEFIQCWNHVVGTGAHQHHSFNVCLHLEEPFPVLCLYSLDYRSRINDEVMKSVGFGDEGIVIEDEAFEEVINKADEIAEKLKIEHRENFNDS